MSPSMSDLRVERWRDHASRARVQVDEDGAHVRSSAALRVLKHCGQPYSALYCFMAFPAPMRDLGYRFVASIRYRVFGKDDGSTCRRMTAKMRTRFLSSPHGSV